MGLKTSNSYMKWIWVLIYFDRKKKRIVYKIIKNEIRIYIISVWERDDLSVYKEAFSLLSRW